MISAALAVLENDEQRNELSELYRKNTGVLFSIALARLHNWEDAEEAVQEAFLAIAKSPECLFRIPKEKRAAYINVIVRNQSFRLWNIRHEREINETELKDDIVDDGPLIEEKICINCSRDEVYKYIDTLSEVAKSSLLLKYEFDLSYPEIAKLLGTTESVVRKRVSRAACKIMEFVEGVKNG